MNRNKQTGQTGFPILSILFLIFLTLKLAGIGVVATWSWWAVTSPLWCVPLGFVIVLFLIGVRVLWIKYTKGETEKQEYIDGLEACIESLRIEINQK